MIVRLGHFWNTRFIFETDYVLNVDLGLFGHNLGVDGNGESTLEPFAP